MMQFLTALPQHSDPAWLRAAGVLHVTLGIVMFGMAPVALVTAKGGKAHRRAGKIYFWSTAAVTASALIASVYRSNAFLTFISLFSFYLAFNGYRVLSRKNPRVSRPALVLDGLVISGTLLACALLVVLGLWKPTPLWASMGTLAVAFGVPGVIITGLELRSMLVPPRDRRRWWYAHMLGMVGSYLAALSAFSVTTMSFLPSLVRWLWPMTLGLPLLIVWILYYQRRFNPVRPATGGTA